MIVWNGYGFDDETTKGVHTKMEKKKENRTTLSLPKTINEQIQEALSRGFYNTKSDFVKTAIRHELERELLYSQLRNNGEALE